MASAKQQLRHVVLFKFKDTTSAEDIKNLENEFRTLATVKLPEIVKAYEWGTNVSNEKLDHGYTHCFLLTFDNEQDRDVYLVHKDHTAYVDLLKPHLGAATVIDYWATS